MRILEKKYNEIDDKTVLVDIGTLNINNSYYKNKLRAEIKNEVGDDKDIIADISKLQGLLFGFVRVIYSVLTEDQKSNIESSYRQAMEYAIGLYENTTTCADAHWSLGGSDLLNKLFLRENIIGEKVTTYLSKKV